MKSSLSLSLKVTLQRNRTLTLLDVGFNNIGDAGEAAFRNALAFNTTLSALPGVDGLTELVERNLSLALERRKQTVRVCFVSCLLARLWEADKYLRRSTVRFLADGRGCWLVVGMFGGGLLFLK